MRVCWLALVGVLELSGGPVNAQEAELSASEMERPGAFELAAKKSETVAEDRQIFTPLSPITVEKEPVKLPQDQSLKPERR